ncbi:hypothetical protein, partial [Actinomadura sp. CNU-125]|uniref:hypothetical protein n=1 Tax=Actinomadura sp. CNU-125 TaxID=1904961 RepID=UPI0021CCC72A
RIRWMIFLLDHLPHQDHFHAGSDTPSTSTWVAASTSAWRLDPNRQERRGYCSWRFGCGVAAG